MIEKSENGRIKIHNTQILIDEINVFIHQTLDKVWMAEEWLKKENGEPSSKIHPLVNTAYTAYQQINDFITTGTAGITEEIFELSELAIKINTLHKISVLGLQKRLQDLISHDYSLYLTARYELQIAGMLLQRGHEVEFVEVGDTQTPDILIRNSQGECEIECKHKELEEDQIDYIKSIYNSTQKARKQFSKTHPSIIAIEIAKCRFEKFQREQERLKEEIDRAMRNSSTISAILLTSKVLTDDKNDLIYRHRVAGFINPQARQPLPQWLATNIVNA